MRTSLLLLSTLLLGACSSGIISQGSEVRPGQYKDKLEVENYALYSKIDIRDVRMRRLGDLLNVQVTLHHESHKTGKYQYRFKWLDANNFEIASESTPWQPVELYGRQDYTVEGIAPSPAADKFRIVFRAQ